MTDDPSGPKPTEAPSPRKTTMLDVQMVMAETQRAMAQALLALSSGRVLEQPLASTTVDDNAEFIHRGFLNLCNGELRLMEDNGDTPTLDTIADRGNKRIRLEFALSNTEQTTRTSDDRNLFQALEAFLLKRAGGIVPMTATCPHRAPPSGPPAPAPEAG